MKVIRVIFTICGCALIFLGAYSAATFLLQRDLAPVQVDNVQTEPEQQMQTPEPETTSEPETETEDPEKEARLRRAQEILDNMSLEEQIYQLMFVQPEAITGVTEVTMAGEATHEALTRYPVGGLIYRKENLQDAQQTKQLLENTASYYQTESQIAPFLGIYDDGSESSPVVAGLAQESLDTFATTGLSGSGAQAEALGEKIGASLADYSFNVNFAAGAELDSARSDCFSANGTDAALMVSSYVTGLQAENVAAVLAHFPGEGAAENGVCNKTEAELQESDLLPFVSGISSGALLIQVSNMTATTLDDSTPCCLSAAVMSQLLRDTLAFDGVILTDPLNGSTISANYEETEAAVLALSAGADMLYGLSDPEDVYAAILSALQSGELTEENIAQSVSRILYAKLTFGIIS